MNLTLPVTVIPDPIERGDVMFRHFALVLGTFTFCMKHTCCLFPPFQKVSELVTVFYLSNIKLF